MSDPTADALIILTKFPRLGTTKTRLAARYGDAVACQIAERFLVDLVGRFSSVADLRTIIVGASGDTVTDFVTLLHRYGLDPTTVEIYLPGTGSMEGDLFAAYRHALTQSRKAVLTGVDIPYLSVAMVRRMFDGLDRCDLVFHPSADGGACPHGMRTPIDLFTGTDSRSSGYLDEWCRRIQRLGLRYEILDLVFDIDTVRDLQLFGALQRLFQLAGRTDQYCPSSMAYLESLPST